MKKEPTFLFVFYILILTLLLSYSSQAKNLFTNPDFESEDLSQWLPYQGELSRIESPVFNEQYSLKMTGRSRNEDGVSQDVSDKITPGYRYTVSGHTRLEQRPWDQLSVFLVLSQDTSFRNMIFLGRVDANNTSWAQFAYTFTVPDTAKKYQLSIFFRPSFSTTNFYLDDLALRPSIQIKTTSTEDGEKLSVDIGPLTADQEGLTANLQIQDIHENIVFEGTPNLAEDSLIMLENGFYRASANAIDSDGLPFTVEKTFCAGDMNKAIAHIIKGNQKLTVAPEKSACHGWLKYLQYLLEDTRERFPENIEAATDAAYRLHNWMMKIQENPNLMNDLKGVIEWAYLSKVDNSGQPFKLAIPTDYDPNQSFALEITVHGHGGNHLEYSGGVQSQPGLFQLHVLGRARGGGYTDLSEVDVLDALEYVKKYWRIDPTQIHIVGASMGGWGSFRLAVRYPHLFASARPQCGMGATLPIENMLHIPTYSTHSVDDNSVPVLHSRGPLQKLIRFGGKAIIDETSGLGHAAWDYTEGNRRATEFARNYKLPDLNQINRIHYTAMDGIARRAYWTEVVEWGPEPSPAIIDARIDASNMLFLDLENIGILKIYVNQSSINPKENLQVVIDGRIPLIYHAPVPDIVYIKKHDGNWILSEDPGKPTPYRLHYPGGAHSLYKGEPLLIVWGTQADAETNKRIYDAAQAARKSSSPTWPDDQGDGYGGVPHDRLLYSTLLGKPDHDVTEHDLQKYNLLLIGTAKQNSIVAKIADQLPVKLRENKVECSDGISWKIRDAAVGFCYYNPKAPQQLIFWIASNNPQLYQAESQVLNNMIFSEVTPDLVVASMQNRQVIASRYFDSHWNWEPNYKEAPFCSSDIKTNRQMRETMAIVFQKATGSDASLIYISGNSSIPSYPADFIRIADLMASDYYMPIAEMTLSGKKMMAYQQWFQKNASESGQFMFFPQIKKSTIQENQMYRVALHPQMVWDLTEITIQHPPDQYRITDIQIRDAIEKYFPLDF